MEDAVIYRSDPGHVLLRRGARVTLYARRPIADVGTGFQRALQAWLDFVPADGQRWALIGSSAEKSKPFDRPALTRALAQLDPTKAAKRRRSYLNIGGPNDPPDEYSFSAWFIAAVDGKSTACHALDLGFPPAFAEEHAAQLLELVGTLVGFLPVDSGHASPALLFPDNMDLKGAGKLIGPLAMRHPGYDVGLPDASCDLVGGRCQGARWVTLLGPTQAAALGGVAGVKAGAAPGISVTLLGETLVLRAGEQGEIGDTNRGQDLPLLRALARQLEPATLFGDDALISVLGRHRDAWERRFLADAGGVP